MRLFEDTAVRIGAVPVSGNRGVCSWLVGE